MGNCPAQMQQSFCAFIRHGERSDQVQYPLMLLPLSQTNLLDPPLTKIGVAQAILTGKFLNDYFQNEYRPAKLVIKSSPFLRCIMTACAIASQIRLGKKHPIVEVDGLNAEVLSSEMFDCNPIPDLEIYNCRSIEDVTNLKKKYIIENKVQLKINKESRNQIEKVYPEEMGDTILRLVKQWIKSQKNHSRRTAVINVSHCMHICWTGVLEKLRSDNSNQSKKLEQILNEVAQAEQNGEKISQKTKNSLQKILELDFDKEPDYCSITAGLHIENNHELLLNSSSGHLESKLAIQQIKFLAGIK